MPDMRLVDIRTGTCNGTYATGMFKYQLYILKYIKIYRNMELHDSRVLRQARNDASYNPGAVVTFFYNDKQFYCW
jgi:hypothetical protein